MSATYEIVFSLFTCLQFKLTAVICPCVYVVLEGILISCSSTLQYLRAKYLWSRARGNMVVTWQSFIFILCRNVAQKAVDLMSTLVFMFTFGFICNEEKIRKPYVDETRDAFTVISMLLRVWRRNNSDILWTTYCQYSRKSQFQRMLRCSQKVAASDCFEMVSFG